MRRFLHIAAEWWSRTPWQVVLLCFVVPFLIRNLLLPMAGDDFSYAFIWDGEHWGNLMDDIGPRERIGGLWDIVVSQWSHYFTWGGRTFSMLWIQFFAWVGKAWFDVANTMVFTLLMLVLYWMAVGDTVSPARHKGVFLWVMLGMLFGIIDYPTTMLWMTGACVYLWTGLWECLFLLPYVTRKHPPAWLMALLGLQAGWSEEAGSLVTVILTAWIIFTIWRQKRLEKWMAVGFVFLVIGCCFLIFCPGSLHREQLMLELAPEYVLPTDKLYSLEMFRDHFTEGFLPILLWESFLLIPVILKFEEGGRRKEEGGRCWVFTVGGLLVLGIMMLAPEFELRTGFHSTLFLTVGSAAALKEMAPWLRQALSATPLRRATVSVAGCLAVVYSLFVLIGCFIVETSYRQQFDERLSYVMQHREADSLIVPSYQIPYHLDDYLGPRSLTEFHLIYAADVESKSTDNRSLMYARYYGLPPIRIDRDVDWKKRDGE